MKSFTTQQITKIYSEWFKKLQSKGRNHNDFLPILIRASKLFFNIDEKWRHIEGLGYNYSVSIFGRARSEDREVNHPKGGKAIRKGKLLVLNSDIDGYAYICASISVKCKKH